LSTTGTMALVNPFRFSNKYEDDESGFNYYGYRFYNPDIGRWLNRDPLAEHSFQIAFKSRAQSSMLELRKMIRIAINSPAVFVSNAPINSFDILGLSQTALTQDEIDSCKANITRALNILRNKIKGDCSKCRNHFNQTPLCKNKLLDRLNNLTVSIDNTDCDADVAGYAPTTDGKWEIFVCPRACRNGRWCLAETIVHELYHECNNDTGTGDQHNDDSYVAETECGLGGTCV
jgi:RHS repeat-associated protein